MTKWFDEIKPVNYDWTYIDIDLGNICTYKCSYCPTDAHDGSVPWLDINALKQFIGKVFKHHTTVFQKELFVFNLLGGEPTLYPYIEELCAFIKEQGKKYSVITWIELLTNGYRKVSWWKDNIDLYDNAKISFHPEYADASHVRDVCDLLVENKKCALVQVLMYPDKWQECVSAIELMIKTRKKLWPLQPKTVQIDFGPEPYFYTNEQKQWMKDNLYTYTSENDINYHNKMFLNGEKVGQVLVYSIIAEKQHSFVNWECFAGIDLIRVKRQGDFKLGGVCRMEYPGFTDKTIYDDDYILPSRPTICKQTWCSCGADIKVQKRKVNV